MTMNKCENCVKSDVCVHRANIKNDTYAYMGVTYDTENCPHYKDKSLFVEIPCEIGKPVFFFVEDGVKSEVFNGKVVSITYEQNAIWVYCRYDNGLTFHHTIEDIGKTVFLTKEEAEKKLKEIEGV